VNGTAVMSRFFRKAKLVDMLYGLPPRGRPQGPHRFQVHENIEPESEAVTGGASMGISHDWTAMQPQPESIIALLAELIKPSPDAAAANTDSLIRLVRRREGFGCTWRTIR